MLLFHLEALEEIGALPVLLASLDEGRGKEVGLEGHKSRPYPDLGLNETCTLLPDVV